MDHKEFSEIAACLCQAEQGNKITARPSAGYPGRGEAEGYAIQMEACKWREDRGACVVGKKVGVTNREMQKAMNADGPVYGHIFDYHLAPQEIPLRLGDLITPFIEPEIAFLLKSDLCGPGVSVPQVLAATEGVMPAFEVLNSRYAEAKFNPFDTLADNAHCGRIVLGGRLTSLCGLDLRTAGLVLEKNGAIVGLSAAAAILGNPAASVAWLANKSAPYGGLKAGEIIMAGSFTTAYPAAAGDVFTAHVGGMGSVTVSFTA